MGNRAVMQFGREHNAPAIYLHWNGGRASIEGFLRAARELGVRSHDPSYGAARVAQIIGNFFGGTTSVGIGTADTLDSDNGDNGLFVIEGLQIVERQHRGNTTVPEVMDEEDQKYADGVYKLAMEANEAIFKKGA